MLYRKGNRLDEVANRSARITHYFWLKSCTVIILQSELDGVRNGVGEFFYL